ncbi:MAG: choice-of-anchor B family protein [Bacteroidota bacterium]
MKSIIKVLVLLQILFFISCNQESPTPTNSEEISYTLLSQLDVSGDVNDLWGYENGADEFIIVTSLSNETEEGEVVIINISDPLAPTVATRIQEVAVDAKVWNNYLYIVAGSNTDNEVFMGHIFDITDPTEPQKVGSIPDFHNIYIDDLGYLYVTGVFQNPTLSGSTGLEVGIYDLNREPELPQLVSSIPSSPNFIIPAHDIFVKGDRLYIFSTSGSYVEIVDIQDKSLPRSLGRYTFANNENVHSGWVTEDDQYLYVCLEEAEDAEIDVVILDISNVSSITPVGTIHDTENVIHNVYIIENIAYASFYNAGFRVYDVTDPVAPSLVYSYDTNPLSEGLGAFGVYPFSKSGVIAVSDWANGLYLFKRDNP